MKPTVCVRSCLKDLDRGCHNLIRGTWGNALRDLGITVKFFVGLSTDPRRSYHFLSDEAMVDSKDDLPSLPHKVRAICRWATGKHIDQIYIVDVDTFIYPKKFAASDYSLYDYAGLMLGNDEPGATYPYTARNLANTGIDEFHEKCYQWASGGNGYFLSRKAYSEIAAETPTSLSDDLWVGQVIGPFIRSHEMVSSNIPKGTISRHYWAPDYGGQPYDPKCGWMEKLYKEAQ